jgi:hypothetical protein
MAENLRGGAQIQIPEKEKGEREEDSLETIMNRRGNRRGSLPQRKVSDQNKRPPAVV